MATYNVSGKTALITGAARGIGFATAQVLLDRGANVVIVDLDQENSVAAAARLHDTRAMGLGADVTDRAAMQRAVSEAVERFGGLDIVVSNAGIAPRGATFRVMPSESFDRVIDVDLMGVVRTVDAALPQIVERGGHVVVIASVYAFVNGMAATPYAMAKAGVEQFGRALRVELVPHGASASVAYFGFIDTDMVHEVLDNDPSSAQMMKTIPRPLRKRLQPSAAGEAIAAGIESRAARIIRPKRWAAFSALRGVINPVLDRATLNHKQTQTLIRDFDSRE
jgi:NAD(P)-dependent dehydrogenase (short-subunit alcohol dehydrogenase family)